MITTEERFLIGLKVLDRLRSDKHSQREQFPREDEHPLGSLDFEAPPDNAPLPPLSTLLAQAGPLAPWSVVLGVCEDGLPFLLDLRSPAPGSLLICGDPGSGKTRALQGILASAGMLNPQDEVQAYLATPEPEEWIGPAGDAPFPPVTGAGFTSELVDPLVEIAHRRWYGEQGGPVFLLAVDGLASCLQWLEADALNRFAWLVRHGPEVGIWVLATLSSAQAHAVEPALVSAFGTRLVGRTISPELAAYLSGSLACHPQSLTAGVQFSVPFGEEWIRIWVCDPR